MQRARINRTLGGHRHDCGFTLIEVLASLLFLAILVPVIVSGLSLSGRVSELSSRRSVAVELAENQLNAELVGNAWQSASATQGDFGTDYPGYRWQLIQESWSQDTTSSMMQLTMEVTFPVRGQNQTVRLSTLVSSAVAQLSPTTGQTILSASSATTSTGGTQ